MGQQIAAPPDNKKDLKILSLLWTSLNWFTEASIPICANAKENDRLTVQLDYVHLTVPLDNEQWHELHTTFQANASVECDVYDRRGEKILLA